MNPFFPMIEKLFPQGFPTASLHLVQFDLQMGNVLASLLSGSLFLEVSFL